MNVRNFKHLKNKRIWQFRWISQNSIIFYVVTIQFLHESSSSIKSTLLITMITWTRRTTIHPKTLFRDTTPDNIKSPSIIKGSSRRIITWHDWAQRRQGTYTLSTSKISRPLAKRTDADEQPEGRKKGRQSNLQRSPSVLHFDARIDEFRK